MPKKVKLTSLNLGFIFLVGMSFSTTSYANSAEEAVKSCRIAIDAIVSTNTEMGEVKPSYKFKRITGASLKRLTFVSKTDKGTKAVICKFKRGQVKDIIDDNGVSLMKLHDKDKE